MFEKLLLTASFAALFAVAPAAAQDQGAGGDNPVIMQEQGQSQGQDAGDAARTQQPDMNQATGDQGKMNNQKANDAQKATGEQPATEAQATGQENQPAKKKVQQGTQAEQGGTANDQNTQQNRQDDQQLTTGTTGKAERDIPAEKRTVIRERIITRNVQRVDRDRIDFDINVGVAVPSTIQLQPLPADIVEVVPAYSGYNYFVLADGTIVIVDPGSLQIVYVLVG